MHAATDNRPGLWIPLNVWDTGGESVGKKFDWESLKPESRDLSLTPSTRAAMGLDAQDEDILL